MMEMMMFAHWGGLWRVIHRQVSEWHKVKCSAYSVSFKEVPVCAICLGLQPQKQTALLLT